MNKKIINIGILGFGSIGIVHSYAISNLKFYMNELPFFANLYGVCTTNIEKSKSVAEKYGFCLSSDNEDELINNPNIDVIDICTPNIYHFDTLKKAIKAGKHVYCEKPLCINYEQAKEISELAKSTKTIKNIVFNNRFIAPIMRAKEIIDEGRIGRILSFSVDYLHSSAVDITKTISWKQNKDICGGGVLYDLGSHVIDLIYYLCGEFDEVSAMTQIAYPQRTGLNGKLWETNADEAFYMIAKLKNGAYGTISASKISVGSNDDIILEIKGEKGALRFSLMDSNWLYFYDNTAKDSVLGGYKGYTKIECVGRYPAPQGTFPSPKASSGWIRGHITSMYNFLSSVYSGIQTAPDLSDGAYVNAVMDAVYLSSEEKKFIKVVK